MLPVAKAHTSRKITAVAMITGATAGLRWLTPLDSPSIVMRWACMAFGLVGFLWLSVLLIFPPEK
jgi:hypothetical protein